MVIYLPDEEGSAEEDPGKDDLSTQCRITIQHPTRISHAVSGFLLGSTKKCFAFARDKVVEFAELFKKQLQTLHTVKVFGCICNMTTLLFLDDPIEENDRRVRKDVLVLTTDAGKLIILKYQNLSDFDNKLLQKQKSEQKLFEKIVYQFCEPGYHAEFPGHFLTTDPRGRAILIGAVLDKMIVFIKPQSEGDPLKNLSIFVIDYAGYIIHDMVGLKPVNNLFEFAILRSKYMEKEDGVHDIDVISCSYDGKLVQRSEKLGNKAELLAPVEPIGVLAVSKHSIVYKSLDSRKLHLKKEIKVLNIEDYFRLVTPFMEQQQLHIAQSFKGKTCLIQVISEAKEISVVCVDVLPVARCWCTLNETHLFLSSEVSDHILYYINYGSRQEDNILGKDVQPKKKQIFEPVFTLPNYSPLFDFQIGDLTERGFSQMYVVGGRSNHSHLRVLEHGCKIERDEELYWSIDSNSGDEECNSNAAWICEWKTEDNLLAEDEVLLFMPEVETTSVFILNCSKEDSSKRILPLEARVEPFPFCTDNCTLCCVQLGKEILQIIPSKILLISETDIIWSAEQDAIIQACAVNKFNVGISSNDGFLQYIWFGCKESGLDVENEKPPCEVYGSFYFPLILLAIGKVREKNKSPLIAVVDSENTVTVVYLEWSVESQQKEWAKEADLREVEKRRFSQEKITSIEIMSVKTSEGDDDMNYFSSGYEEYLLVGFENGCVFKRKLNGYKRVCDDLDDDMYRLDLACIRMLKVEFHNQEAVITKSVKEKQYIFCYFQGLFHLFPLISDVTYDFYIPFPQEENCLLGYRNSQVDFITYPTFGYMFAQSKVKLECTPCRIILDEFWKKIIVLERERKVFSTKEFIIGDNEENSVKDSDTRTRSGWFSQIEIIDSFDLKKKYLVPLKGNAYAMSACTINTSPESGFLIVCALLKFEEVKERNGTPVALSYEITYGFEEKKDSIRWLDKTVLGGLPTTICSYKGKILIAEGFFLGLYRLHKQRLELLSKMKLADKISSICTNPKHNMIFVGYVKYNVSIFCLSDCGGVLQPFAEEQSVIPTTSVACLNKDTFALVDNFGNFIMMALESKYSYVNSLDCCSENVQLVIQSKSNVGKIVKIQLKQLHENARPCLLYMTYSGSIGVIFENTQNSKTFLSILQKHMIANTVHYNGCSDLNQEEQCLIDGDLCLEYLSAPKDFKNVIANEMKRSPKFIFDCLQHMKLIHYIWTN